MQVVMEYRAGEGPAGHQPLFAVFEQTHGAVDVLVGKARLLGDRGVQIAPPLELADIAEQLQRPVLAAGQVPEESEWVR